MSSLVFWFFFLPKSKLYWPKHYYYHLAKAFVFYLRPPPPLCLHPCIPRFLSPSRQCIPIPHTVAVSSGESCLPCATGPTKRCCSRASPHRPEGRADTGEKARTHTEIFLSFDRVTLGKSLFPVILGVTNVHVPTCSCFFCLFFPPSPRISLQLSPPWWLRWGN